MTDAKTPKQQRPTRKQRELLTFVENFIAGHGYGPSYREIRSGMGYNSVATVAKHIDNLIARGHLRKKDHSARSLELVNASDAPKLPVRGAAPKEQDEKWLVARVEDMFVVAEQAEPMVEGAIEDLQTVVSSLKILGIEGAAASFGTRLAALKEKKKT